MIVNKDGYVMRKTSGGQASIGTRSKRRVWRDWWLLKHKSANRSELSIKYIVFPPEYIGKKIKIKIEIINDKEEKHDTT